jgi:hypothetical protein
VTGAAPGARRARFVGFVAVVAAACGRAGPEPAVSEVSVVSTGAAVAGAGAAAMVDGGRVDAGPEDAQTDAADEADEVDEADAAAVADGWEPGFDAHARPDDVLETVSLERCQVACDNAKRVTLVELSPDIAPPMREAIERAMTRECPARCVERASVSAVRCIETARTALELAGCPR